MLNSNLLILIFNRRAATICPSSWIVAHISTDKDKILFSDTKILAKSIMVESRILIFGILFLSYYSIIIFILGIANHTTV